MNKSIILLMTVLVISTSIGTATAILVPISLETPTTVQLYTVSVSQLVTPPQFAELNCDSGDTVVSGYIIYPDGESGEVNTVAINNGEGMIVSQQGSSSVVVVTYQIVCAKTVTMTVGGLQLPTDTTALLLGYTILNSYWIAPMAIGIGVGIYLVKRKIE